MQPYVPILRSPSPTPNPLRICATGVASFASIFSLSVTLSSHLIYFLQKVPDKGSRWRYERVHLCRGICGGLWGVRGVCKGCDGIVHLTAKYTRLERPVEPWVSKKHREIMFNELIAYWKWVHNANVAMSYNKLSIAAELGINRVAMASSVNAVGMCEWWRNLPFAPINSFRLWMLMSLRL